MVSALRWSFLASLQSLSICHHCDGVLFSIISFQLIVFIIISDISTSSLKNLSHTSFVITIFLENSFLLYYVPLSRLSTKSCCFRCLSMRYIKLDNENNSDNSDTFYATHAAGSGATTYNVFRLK